MAEVCATNVVSISAVKSGDSSISTECLVDSNWWIRTQVCYIEMIQFRQLYVTVAMSKSRHLSATVAITMPRMASLQISWTISWKGDWHTSFTDLPTLLALTPSSIQPFYKTNMLPKNTGRSNLIGLEPPGFYQRIVNQISYSNISVWSKPRSWKYFYSWYGFHRIRSVFQKTRTRCPTFPLSPPYLSVCCSQHFVSWAPDSGQVLAILIFLEFTINDVI